MTPQDQSTFDPRIADWLEDDPNTAPDQALEIVLAALPSIKQRHASRLPWRFTMTTLPRLAIGAAAIVVVVLAGAFLLRPPASGAGGGVPTPSPSPPRRHSVGRPITVDLSASAAFGSDRFTVAGWKTSHLGSLWLQRSAHPAALGRASVLVRRLGLPGGPLATPASEGFIAPGLRRSGATRLRRWRSMPGDHRRRLAPGYCPKSTALYGAGVPRSELRWPSRPLSDVRGRHSSLQPHRRPGVRRRSLGARLGPRTGRRTAATVPTARGLSLDDASASGGRQAPHSKDATPRPFRRGRAARLLSRGTPPGRAR